MQKTRNSRPGQAKAVHSSPWLAALILSAGAVLTVGCDRDQVTHATTTKEAPAPSGGAAGMPPGAPAMGNMAGAELPPPPRPSGNSALKWTLPKGWTESQGSGMRFATLIPPGGGKAELSVVVLPGAAGGEVANVNRWRGQIGLPPMDDKALASAKQVIKSKAGPVSLYDFTSEGQAQSRMISGLLTTADGNTWFLKLTGDAAPVGKAKPDLLRFLETLHLD